MAAFPNQGDGAAIECEGKDLKGERTAMTAFPDQVGELVEEENRQ